MSIDRRLEEMHTLKRNVEALRDDIASMVRYGGQGGDGGSVDQMDRRVTRLEGQGDKIVETLGDLRSGLASLDERTKHMPTRFEFYTVIFGTGAFFSTLLVLAIRLQWI